MFRFAIPKVLQSDANQYYQYDLGIQAHAVFINNSVGDIHLHYHAADGKRHGFKAAISNLDVLMEILYFYRITPHIRPAPCIRYKAR